MWRFALAITTLGETTGKPLTILALARHLGLANTTFRRHVPDIADDLWHRRSAADATPDEAAVYRFDQLKRDNGKLRPGNHELIEHLDLATANIQRLTLETTGYANNSKPPPRSPGLTGGPIWATGKEALASCKPNERRIPQLGVAVSASPDHRFAAFPHNVSTRPVTCARPGPVRWSGSRCAATRRQAAGRLRYPRRGAGWSRGRPVPGSALRCLLRERRRAGCR